MAVLQVRTRIQVHFFLVIRKTASKIFSFPVTWLM